MSRFSKCAFITNFFTLITWRVLTSFLNIEKSHISKSAVYILSEWHTMCHCVIMSTDDHLGPALNPLSVSWKASHSFEYLIIVMINQDFQREKNINSNWAPYQTPHAFALNNKVLSSGGEAPRFRVLTQTYDLTWLRNSPGRTWGSHVSIQMRADMTGRASLLRCHQSAHPPGLCCCFHFPNDASVRTNLQFQCDSKGQICHVWWLNTHKNCSFSHEHNGCDEKKR